MNRTRCLMLAFLMFSAVLLPLTAPPVAASDEINVTLSSQHEYLTPGTAANLSLTVTNDNLMNTRSFDISLDTTFLPSDWNVTLVDTTLGPVFPTQSDSTILVVRLDPGASLGANGQVDVTVTRSDDANESTTVTLHLSVAPLYLPALDVGAVGDRGLIAIEPNQTVDVDIPVMNAGNIDDSIILQIDEALDLGDFWTNWNSSQSNNTGGNGTGNGTGNNTGGNGTGNGTGNNTGGNGTGNGTGNNTGGNGTSMRGPARDVPIDWDVRWLDPVAVDMTPGESRNHTLRITIPADATPEYRGIALFAGSLGGNYSIQTVIVVEVTTVSDIRVQVVHDANRSYLPGVTEVVSFEVTNSGNDATSLLYSTIPDSACSAVVDGTVGSELQPLSSEFISMNITPDSSANWNNTCTINIFAEESTTGVSHETAYTIVVGVDWGWEVTVPNATSVSAGATTQLQVAVRNVGSELDEIRFDVSGPNGVTGSGPPGWMSVGRGLSDAITIQVDIDSDVSLVGLHNLTLTATGKHGGEQVVSSIELDIQPRSEISLQAPQGGNVLVAAGSSSNFSVTLTNSGTQNLSIVMDWSGLPSTISLSTDTPVTVEVGEVLVLPITVSANAGSVAATHAANLVAKDANGGTVLASTSLNVEVAHAPAVRLLTSGDTLPVGEFSDSVMEVVVVNEGNQQDQFSFQLEPSTSGYQVTISPLLMTLEAGAQDTLTVSMRRTTATGESSLSLVATSSNDPTVTSQLDFTATEVSLGVALAISSTVTTAGVGDSVAATLWLTNTGNAEQTFQLAVTGLDCPNLSPTQTLSPSPSATPIVLDCTVPQVTPAGVVTLSASATSVHDPAITASAELNITVPADRVNGQPRLVIEVTGSAENHLAHEGSLVLNVLLRNDGNEELTGTLALVGEGAADLSPGWISSEGSSSPTYTLGPGEQATYELTLVSSYLTSGGEQSMRVQAAGPGHQVLSDSFTVTVASKPLPPNGITLGFADLDNQATITALAAGWLVAILSSLILVIVIRSRKGGEEDELLPLTDLPPLGDLPLPPAPVPMAATVATVSSDKPGEAKMVDGRVECTGCEASLKMPADREPPFKFKCPKCSESVRVVK